MAFTLWWRALTALLFIVGSTCAAYAQSLPSLRAVPPLQPHLVDETSTLDASQHQALKAQLAAIEQQHGAQVVVLMVADTAPEDIASFSNRVANTWKMGRREVGDGVLIVIAKDARRMRIEVAKALEGAIPDIAAARIIDEAMKPRFREGDFAGGIQAAIEQLGALIAGEELPPPESTHSNHDDLDWTDLAVFLFFGVVLAGPVARSMLGQGLGSMLMGAGAGWLSFLATSSMLLSIAAGLAALIYTWVFAGRSGPLVSGHAGDVGSHDWGSSWESSAGSDDDGGWSSGGGGDFGGGGASGDW